jgi:hypothetical protein
MRDEKEMTNRTTDLLVRSNMGNYISFRSQICTQIYRHDEKLHICTSLHQVLPCPRDGNGLEQHAISTLLIILRYKFGDEQWTKK